MQLNQHTQGGPQLLALALALPLPLPLPIRPRGGGQPADVGLKGAGQWEACRGGGVDEEGLMNPGQFWEAGDEVIPASYRTQAHMMSGSH